jgi:hypothetical protein
VFESVEAVEEKTQRVRDGERSERKTEQIKLYEKL